MQPWLEARVSGECGGAGGERSDSGFQIMSDIPCFSAKSELFHRKTILQTWLEIKIFFWQITFSCAKTNIKSVKNEFHAPTGFWVFCLIFSLNQALCTVHTRDGLPFRSWKCVLSARMTRASPIKHTHVFSTCGQLVPHHSSVRFFVICDAMILGSFQH